MYDDDVDYLFKGDHGGFTDDDTTNYDDHGMGLLYWCGVSSSKHDGQLKRIAAPAFALLRFLVTLPYNKGRENGRGSSQRNEVHDDADDVPGSNNIFFDRFMQLSQTDLLKVQFVKHLSSSC